MGYTYDIKSYDVVDGDTVNVVLDLGFGLSFFIKCRIGGVNTPEKRGDEKEYGLDVKDCVEKILGIPGMEIKCISKKWDKFGGRIVGDLRLAHPDWIGRSDVYLPEYMYLSTFLTRNKLGHMYDGKTKKKEFTQEFLTECSKRSKSIIEDIDSHGSGFIIT